MNCREKSLSSKWIESAPTKCLTSLKHFELSLLWTHWFNLTLRNIPDFNSNPKTDRLQTIWANSNPSSIHILMGGNSTVAYRYFFKFLKLFNYFLFLLRNILHLWPSFIQKGFGDKKSGTFIVKGFEDGRKAHSNLMSNQFDFLSNQIIDINFQFIE